MGEREDARKGIEDARERVSEIAGELSARTDPRRIANAAAEKAGELGARALRSPVVLGLAGGAAAAAVGWVAWRVLARRAELEREALEAGEVAADATAALQERMRAEAEADRASRERAAARVAELAAEAERRDRGTASTVAAAGAGAAVAAGVTAAAGAAARSARGAVSGAAETAREAAEVTLHAARRAAESLAPALRDADAGPLLTAIGAAAVGAAIAALLPLGEAERELVHPVKKMALDAARHAAKALGEELDAKLSDLAGGEDDGAGRQTH